MNINSLARALGAAAVAAACLAASASMAETLRPMPCDAALLATLKADMQTHNAALDARDKGGDAALRQREGELQAALMHLPATFAPMRCDNQIIIRVKDQAEMLRQVTSIRRARHSSSLSAEWLPEPYDAISLLLGAHYMRTRQWQKAADALAVGSRLDPLNAGPAVEYAFALSALGRDAEALEVCKVVMINNKTLDDREKGGILTAAGLADLGLGNLDQAEDSLQLATQFVPDGALATASLSEIAKQRTNGGAGRGSGSPRRGPKATVAATLLTAATQGEID